MVMLDDTKIFYKTQNQVLYYYAYLICEMYGRFKLKNPMKL